MDGWICLVERPFVLYSVYRKVGFGLVCWLVGVMNEEGWV